MDQENQYDNKKEDPFVYMHRVIKTGVKEATEANAKANAKLMF